MFLWKAKIEQGYDIEALKDRYYDLRAPSKLKVLCCNFCLCKCIRARLITNRLKPKKPEVVHYNPQKLVSMLLMHIIHVFDLFTDVNLALHVYELSRQDCRKGQADCYLEGTGNIEGFKYDYSIVFTWILMATCGPYIIQYSSMMNAIYHKGFFQNIKNFKCCK